MWKNIVERGSPHMTIRRMRIAYWISEARKTHSEYVILIAFPLQKWLPEREYTLHYTYIASLIYLGFFTIIFKIFTLFHTGLLQHEFYRNFRKNYEIFSIFYCQSPSVFFVLFVVLTKPPVHIIFYWMSLYIRCVLCGLAQESQNVIREGSTDFYKKSDSAAGSNSNVDINLEIKLTKRGMLLVRKGQNVA